MGKSAPRLPFVSRDGPEPELIVSAESWHALEACYFPIPVGGRTELIDICNNYLRRAGAERNAARESEVRGIAQSVTISFRGFQDFAYGGNLGRSDAEIEFQRRFDELLTRQTLSLQNSELFFPGTSDENRDGSVLLLNKRIVTEFAIRLFAILDAVRNGQGIAYEQGNGFVPGEAFKNFMAQLQRWAKKHRMPATYRSGGKAGPLARLCYELNRLFPKELREDVISATAVAERSRARR